MKDKLTIIIPSKNEEHYIANLLNCLRHQKLGRTKILIADCSTDNTRQVIQDNSAYLNIEIIEGGPVAVARNRGAKLAKTPFLLFIDADVILPDNYTIRDALFEMESKRLDLVGAKIFCYDDDKKAQLSFSLFNFINGIMKYFSPFCVGAFFLTRKNTFFEYGGFEENYITSEDFFLSKKYPPKKFQILNHYFGQDSRRFKKMGYLGMVVYLLKNFLNRNNPDYWKSQEHTNYWK